MLKMYGFNGGAPLHRAHGGIAAADPSVFEVGGDAVDLTVLPRRTEYRAARAVCQEAWYDLLWTAPADRIFLDHRTYDHSSPAARERLVRVLTASGVLLENGELSEDERLEEAMQRRGRLVEVLLQRAKSRAGALPAPAVIPVEERLERLEAAEPVTLEGMPEEHITLWGGPEKTLRMLRQDRKIAVKNDRSVDIYDWAAWGRAAAATIRELPVPEVA
ncbi:hypothetical protein [Streptomyces nanshensis]|uniref:Uncharacterized protein n=1 Tax=Streptomyces nanshensis TaxID=518642 RepID=A0A1E7L575_9ACTN|nr:hypothetical protein [Streptomyces nanshensis]OEV11342.1 hypothetical protein AN218_13415 [Streptomyces nanshensis]